MNRIKIITIIGTRPEIIRLSRVMNELDKSPSVEHIIVHTGQNYDYELNQIFFEDLSIRRPDHFLNAAGSNAIVTVANIFIAIDSLFENIKPDAILVLGDTNSCLTAIPAKKRHIPIFHMEAGNRCFDQRVPEETNRKIVDHISDINLTYSSIAREYLLREGFPADRVIKTGSPMFEVLNFYAPKIRDSRVLRDLGLDVKKYFLVSFHREENVEDETHFNDFIETLNRIAEQFKYPVIVSTHPRTRKKIELKQIQLNEKIRLLKPLGFSDYNALQISAKVVLSDSGTISEESSILGFSALNLRQTHERPEAMEEAAVLMVGLKSDRVIQGILQIEQTESNITRIVSDYSLPNVSTKVVKIIISYIDYINRTVWQKRDSI